MVPYQRQFRFFQEARADAAEKLKAIINVTATAVRDGAAREMPLPHLDLAILSSFSAGDMIRMLSMSAQTVPTPISA